MCLYSESNDQILILLARFYISRFIFKKFCEMVETSETKKPTTGKKRGRKPGTTNKTTQNTDEKKSKIQKLKENDPNDCNQLEEKICKSEYLLEITTARGESVKKSIDMISSLSEGVIKFQKNGILIYATDSETIALAILQMHAQSFDFYYVEDEEGYTFTLDPSNLHKMISQMKKYIYIFFF